jgi:hypothetical protein
LRVKQNYQQLLNNPRLAIRSGGGKAAEKPIKVLDHTDVPEQPRLGKPNETIITKQRQINKSELENWYQKQDDVFKDPRYLASHTSGTDFTKPVYIKTLPAGTEIIQYEGPRGPGMYATYPGTSMDACAVCGKRTLVSYKSTAPIEVIETTAAEFPKDIIPNVGGKGGGQQILLPTGWQNSAIKLP